MKKGDIVRFKVDEKGKMQEGSVNWVDKGNAGITMIGKEFHFANEYVVMPVEDCEVVTEHKGDTLKEKIRSAKTDDLKAAIQRLKGMRFPRKIKGRTRSVAPDSRRKKMTRLLDAIDGDPSVLDTLIEKALKEDK